MADFDTATDWVPDQNGTFEGTLDDGWAQGRSIFGGIQTAGCIRLLQHLSSRGHKVNEVHTRYVGPLTPGPFKASAAVLRAGKSIHHLEARVWSNGELATVVQASFARPRRSQITLTTGPARPLPDPESFTDLPHVPGLTPAFLQRVQLRWTEGGAPFAGATEARLAGLCRVPDTQLDAAPIALALLDAYPTPALPMLQEVAPASTIAWTAHLYDLPQTGSGWWWFEEDGMAGRDGTMASAGKLYAPDGRLVASKTQLAAVYG